MTEPTPGAAPTILVPCPVCNKPHVYRLTLIPSDDGLPCLQAVGIASPATPSNLVYSMECPVNRIGFSVELELDIASIQRAINRSQG